jgi:hypothetical protein
MHDEDHYRSLKTHMSNLRVHDHVCMAYEDREQQVTAIAHYLIAGLGLGEKCIYIADKSNSDFVMTVLKDTGIDVESLIEKGKLAVMAPEDTYMRTGRFDADDVINNGKLSIAATLEQGFTGLRCACDMSWVKTYKISPKMLLDYENKVNCLFEDKIVSICQYNTHLFDEQTIDSLLQNHPVSIHGGNVVRNPQFAPPNNPIAIVHEQTA